MILIITLAAHPSAKESRGLSPRASPVKQGRVVTTTGGTGRPGNSLLLPHAVAEPEPEEDWPPDSHPGTAPSTSSCRTLPPFLSRPGMPHTCSALMRHLEARPWALGEQAHHRLVLGDPWLPETGQDCTQPGCITPHRATSLSPGTGNTVV